MERVKSDIEIARAAKMLPIGEVLGKINVPDDPVSFSPMGRHIAKLNFDYIDKLKEKKKQFNLSHSYNAHTSWRGKNYHICWS